MKTLIIEDELPAARRLKKLLTELEPQVEVLDTLDSVSGAVAWLRERTATSARAVLPELIFMDIHLSDGLSFEIFGHVTVPVPVIFTTAYDEYSLRAFKVNSVDYLLKPVSVEELRASVEKFKNLQSLYSSTSSVDFPTTAASALVGDTAHLQSLFASLIKQEPTYKTRFLVQQRDRLLSIPVSDVAYWYSEHKLTHLVTHTGATHIIEQTLEDVESQVSPKEFFRVNRQFMVSVVAIAEIHTYFHGKLKLTLKPAVKASLNDDVVVSREKAALVKQWLDR